MSRSNREGGKDLIHSPGEGNLAGEAITLGPFRGLILIIFGLLALYRGWTMGWRAHAWVAYALGIVALALGAWHIVRESKRRLR